MSKEREAFALKLEKHFIFLEPECDDGFATGQTVIPIDKAIDVATTHYQPLLDAKDAEIARLWENVSFAAKVVKHSEMLRKHYSEQNTTLKALLEQAHPMEVAWINYKQDMRPETRNDFLRACSAYYDNRDTAINAASPLILDEAAKVCDAEKYTSSTHMTKERNDYNYGCDDCAQAIRDLKGE